MVQARAPRAAGRLGACQLPRLGFVGGQASAAPAALAMLERDGSIELLFTDIVLPEGISGLELARRARAIRPGLRVLFTSGYPEDAATGIAAAALLYGIGAPPAGIRVRQGEAMGRPSEIQVRPDPDGPGCRIGGRVERLA